MTRITRPLVLAALLAFAAGCTPNVEKDAIVFGRDLPKPEPTLVHYAHDVQFAPSESRPSALEVRTLERFLAEHGVSRNDEIAISTGRDDRLNGTDAVRRQALAQMLQRRGLRAAVLPGAFDETPRTPGLVRVTVHRTLVTLPACPDWSGNPKVDSQNQPFSNFGCADAVNLGLMVARPSDLSVGRPSGTADGEYGAAAVERYRQGKTKPFIEDGTNPSPVTVNMTQSSGGGGAQ